MCQSLSETLAKVGPGLAEQSKLYFFIRLLKDAKFLRILERRKSLCGQVFGPIQVSEISTNDHERQVYTRTYSRVS